MKSKVFTIIRILNILLALPLLANLLIQFSGNHMLWWLNLLGLLFPFLLLINLIFIIFWLRRKRKEVFISALAIVININTVFGYFQFPITKKPQTDDSSIKVMTFNTRLFDRYSWIDRSANKSFIFDFIREEDPDIICFQEYFVNEHGALNSKYINEQLGDTYYKAENTFSVRSGMRYGTAIYSKFPIENITPLRFKESMNSSLYCDLKINEEIVRVINVHLQSISFNKQAYNFFDSLKFSLDDEQMNEIRNISSQLQNAYVKRFEQTREIEQIISNTDGPIIVCGDFNDPPASFSYKRLRKLLNDSFRKSGSGIGNTYNGNMPSFRIDYIFYSDDFEASEYRIHKRDVSDHFPVSVKLKLKNLL